MDISGSYTLYAPRDQVWNALLDPGILKQTVPGCESLEKVGENEYAVRMNVGVAGVKGIYDGTLRVLDAHQPESYRMVVDGSGTRGILHGDGTLHLEAKDATTTTVHYTGQAQLGGAIASVGMRMAGSVVTMLIKQYFARLADLLPAAAPTPVATAATVAAPMPAQTPPAAEQPPAPSAPVEMAAPEPPVSAPTSPVTSGANGATPAQTASAPTAGEMMPADTSVPPAPTPTTTPETVAPVAPTPEPAPVDAMMMPPPTAPIHPPQPASVAPAAPPASTALARRTPLMNIARRAGLTDGTIESEQRWARILGTIIVIVLLVIVALIVWLVAFR